MSCIGIATAVNTDLLLQEWFLLLWDIIAMDSRYAIRGEHL